MSQSHREKSWEIVECQSGFTLRECESGQLMHSVLGPWEEANQIYIGQADLSRRIRSGSAPLVIYDLGLGIGANSIATLDSLISLPQRGHRAVEIWSFERYPEAMAELLSGREDELIEHFPFWNNHLGALRSLISDGEWRSPEEDIRWRLVPGDFLSLDLTSAPAADLMYFDFYAPAVCPELWGFRNFSRLRPQLAPEGLLITYSSTKAVRSAMLLAGFFVGDGVATPMKHETTVAAGELQTLRDPLPRTWLDRLECSSRPLPADWPLERAEEGLRLVRGHEQFGSV